MSEATIKVKLSLSQRKVICRLMPTLYLRLMLITPSPRVIMFALRELVAIHRRAGEAKDQIESCMHRKSLARIMDIVGEAIEKAKAIDSPSA
ncbi:hypothetical protein [Rosistilla oblonga]|uniref:hypothetical protein n=1 Tax=Rosistilla oblonga TaxID=2527990 RepID=UPI003A97CB64